MTQRFKAYTALVFICIVWGTTYLAIRIGVMHYPAFLFAGVRQSVAGIVLMAAALAIRRKYDLSLQNLGRQALVGFLMLSLGNGFVTWGEQYIPSGISALICSLMPLFAVLFNLMFSKKEHFSLLIGSGMALGLCGVGLIFRHNVAEIAKPAYLGGIAGTILATVAWSLGSILNRRDEKPVNAFLNSGMQLFFGGMFMLIGSPFLDNYTGLQLWNTNGILALCYLIVFGSALAYAAYMYSLSVLPVGIATIYAYVNPLIAVIAGYLFLKEDLNIYTGLAFVTIVISVYMVNIGYRRQHARALKLSSTAGSTFPGCAPAES